MLAGEGAADNGWTGPIGGGVLRGSSSDSVRGTISRSRWSSGGQVVKVEPDLADVAKPAGVHGVGAGQGCSCIRGGWILCILDVGTVLQVIILLSTYCIK